MKTRLVVITFLLILFQKFSYCQSQWRFHIAFEDGNGQKDTLWMIYDTSATTSDIDTSLGEGSVTLDQSRFNVYILNAGFDTTKTEAMPYYVFPSHILYNIRAINFTYPIKISWDTALFHSQVLPIQANSFINVAKIDNDYFWGINNDPPLQAYNMLINDTAYAPSFNFGSRSQFPMTISFGYESPIYVESILNSGIKVFPNPAINQINISSNHTVTDILIIDMFGNKVVSIQNVNSTSFQVPVQELKSSMYFLFLKDISGYSINIKFVKL